MKKWVFIAMVICTVWMGQSSCGRRPFACFQTDVDSIRVNQPVTFYASCSSNADDYFWEFNGDDDQTEFGYSVTRTYNAPGKYQVFLLVTNGRRTASTTDSVEVFP